MSNWDAAVQEIAVRRFKKVYLPEIRADEAIRQSDKALAAIQSRMRTLGFMLSGEVMVTLSRMGDIEVKSYVDDLTTALTKLTGKMPNQAAFYPNFPDQVANASEVELYFNAMAHYFGDVLGLRITPDYEVDERTAIALDEMQKLTVLNAAYGGVSDYAVMHADAKSILMNVHSISVNDMEDVKTLVGNSVEDRELFFFDISDDELTGMNRENKAHAVMFAHGEGKNDAVSTFEPLFMTAMTTSTDVLRYAVGRSGGDVSLAKNHLVRFARFPRSERRLMLAALDKLNEWPRVSEDFTRYEHAFKRLATALHPGDYAKAYPSAAHAFKALANGKTPRSFGAEYDYLVNEVKAMDAVNGHLSTRPGEFARRLNHVLSICESKKERHDVLDAFESVVDEVPEKILWSMSTLFEYRNVDKDRIIHPKGMVTKAQILPMPEKAYGDRTAQRVVDIISSALVKKYRALDPLGKVYVDPALAGFTLLTGQRSASRAMRTIGRGTRVPFDAMPVQRFFIWWKDLDHADSRNLRTVDIDLSAVTFGEGFQFRDHVSFTNLRSANMVHSGDFVSAPEGAAEYIDVNVDGLRSKGVRYVAMNVFSYSGQSFSDVECLAGVMGRKDAQSGEIFDARTVEHSFELSADGRHMIPMVIDLENREIIWADLTGNVRQGRGHNVENTMSNGERMVYSIVSKRYASLYQQVVFHALARGELAESPEDADVVYTPENLEEIYRDFPMLS